MKLHLSLLALPAATRALIPTGSKPVPPPMRVATAELFESQEPLLDTLSKKRRRRRWPRNRRRRPRGSCPSRPSPHEAAASLRRGRAQDAAPRRRAAHDDEVAARGSCVCWSRAAPEGWVHDVAQVLPWLTWGIVAHGEFDPAGFAKKPVGTVVALTERPRSCTAAWPWSTVRLHKIHASTASPALEDVVVLTHDALLLKTPGLLLGPLESRRR